LLSVEPTAAAALREARARLGGHGRDARLDASRLLEAASGRDRAWLLAHAGDTLDRHDFERFTGYVARRERGEPVAYILGECGFYGRSFEITRDVLVPRPESEHLIELALRRLREAAARGPRVCDVGTGSGALAVTLCCELPSLEADGIDLSPAALAVADRNARRHALGARIAFRIGDALNGLAAGRLFDGILANLPYVPTAELQDHPDPTAFEPRVALDGGPDGLDAYRRLLERAPHHLVPGGWLLMEAGPGTASALADLAGRAFPASAFVEIHRDYAARERIVAVRG
jgi:release factor glutamine methyltransferase